MEQSNPYAAPSSDVNVNDPDTQYEETNWYSPSGRLGRARYFLRSFGYYFLFAVLIGLVVGLASLFSMELAPIFIIPLAIGYVVIAFFQVIKRMHDLNWSGWWLLLMLVPIVNFVLSLLLLLKGGTEGPNDYGYPAKPASKPVMWIGVTLAILFIIGLLAAVAIPAYQDYVTRAQQALGQ